MHDIPIAAVGEQSKESSFQEWQFTDVRSAQYALAMSNYTPNPLAVRVIYVKVEFDAGAWRRISRDLEVVELPGTHEFPDYASVAEHLRNRLQPQGS